MSNQKVTAFAPATTSNLAVGFDILGMAVNHCGDKVSVCWRDDEKIVIESINNNAIPDTPENNTATIAIEAMRQHFNIKQGVSVWIEKGIPLGSGLGGSAASCVAACVAMAALTGYPLSPLDLAPFALKAEAQVSGGIHGDNVLPCLFGGFILIQSVDPVRIVHLPIPDKLSLILIHPHIKIETKQARALLKPQVALSDSIKQCANLATFIASLYQNNLLLLEQSCKDFLIEPMRKQLIPGFDAVQKAALAQGAMACSLSGSGPTLFAFAHHDKAQQVALAMQQQFESEGLPCDSWVSDLSKQQTKGAYLL